MLIPIGSKIVKKCEVMIIITSLRYSLFKRQLD
jgi:hypothetical protein